MIKAVIFDCFGVLVTDGWLQFRTKHLEPKSDIDRAVTELNRQTDAGQLSVADFQKAVSELISVNINDLKQAMNIHTRNDALFEFIASNIKGKYLVGLLSNAPKDYTAELFTPEQNALFDAKLFSFELNIIKPNPQIYHAITERLGVLPEECVFIDDRDGFVEGAKQAGMRSFRYTELEEMRQNLAKMLE